MMNKISYVTFDGNGALTGGFLQEMPPEHQANSLGVDDSTRSNWPMYRANAARDGLEPLPPCVPDLDALKAAAIAKTYADVDRVYADAVGNRTEEYKDAEEDARDYAASGYSGSVSDYVHDFAMHNPTGEAQTDQWAADQIIARADAFATAKLSMRSNRFARQADMRAATTQTELAAAIAAWDGFIAALRSQLGL